MNNIKTIWWKRLLILSGNLLEIFFAFLFLYLTISIYGAVIPLGNLDNEGDITIYVQSNGVHTDVCLPVRTAQMNWFEFVPGEDFPEDASFEYIAIGWGDKGFFLDTPTWAELKVSTALNAAFLPSPTAMHVAYVAEPKEDDEHIKVHISKKEYTRLVRYVKNSFRLKNGHVDLIPQGGYTKYDKFYEAKHSYHMFRTCNIWTNEALKSANIKTGIFALFPNGIMDHLKDNTIQRKPSENRIINT